MIQKKNMLLSLFLSASLFLFAEDNPVEILQAGTSSISIEKENISLKEKWKKFVNEQKWGESEYAEGVMHFEGRDLIVASGTSFVSVGIGQPGWVESRIIAFEQAELEAKAKIIRFLSEDVDTSRSLSYLEKASWKDGEVEEINQLNDVSQTLKRIGKKTLDLADATLDQALQKMDPDYDKEKYDNISPAEKHTILEQKFKRKIRSTAFKTTIGITPVYNNEAKVDGAYQVIVGVVWSPKLNRLAQGLFNRTYAMKKVTPGKSVNELLSDSKLLLSTYGTRITVDENGDYIVLAYAQAAPRNTSPSRRASAIHDAKEVASNRARALMTNYIREGMELSNREQSGELLREFDDLTVGVEILREVSRKIKGHKTKVKLRGLRQVKEWAEKHPKTKQWVAGTVVAWSPTSMKASQKMEEAMRKKPLPNKEAATKKSTNPAKVDPVDLSSVPVNTSAY